MHFEIYYTGVPGIWDAHVKDPPLYLAITDLALGSKNILQDIPSEEYSIQLENGARRVFEIVYYQLPAVSKAQAMVYMDELWLHFKKSILQCL